MLQPGTRSVEHLDLGERPHESFDLVDDRGGLRARGGHERETEFGPLPLVLVIGLGSGHLEPAARPLDDGLHDGTLVLQGMGMRHVQVHRECEDVYSHKGGSVLRSLTYPHRTLPRFLQHLIATSMPTSTTAPEPPVEPETTDDAEIDDAGIDDAEVHDAAVGDTEDVESDGIGAKRFRNYLLAITAGALVIRFAYILIARPGPLLAGDAWVYQNTAHFVADGHGFIGTANLYFKHKITQTADHPPLYAITLAFFWKLGFQNTLSEQLLNGVFGTVAVFFTGLVGRRIGGVRVGILAALVAALYPNLWFWNATVLSESLALMLVTIIIYVAYRYWDHGSMRDLAYLGVLVSLAALTRGELILLFPMLLLPLIWHANPHRVLDLLRPLLLVGGIALLIFSPWVVYNMSRFKEPVLLSTNFGRSMASGACDMGFYGPNAGFWSGGCLSPMSDPGTKLGEDESQIDKRFRSGAWAYMSDNANAVPRVLSQRLGRTFGLFEPLQQAEFDQTAENRDWWVAGSGLTTFYVLAVAAIPGAYLIRRRKLPIYPLVIPIVTSAIGVMFVFGTTRYRATSETAIVLLAAVGIDAGLEWLSGRFPKPLGLVPRLVITGVTFVAVGFIGIGLVKWTGHISANFPRGLPPVTFPTE